MSDAVDRLNAALEGRYRIERELGEGEMATVYLADGARGAGGRNDGHPGTLRDQTPSPCHEHWPAYTTTPFASS